MIWFGRGLVVSAAMLAACNSDGGSTDVTLETSSTPSKKGSAGGFTASLAADLAGSAGSGGPRTAGTATGEASGSAPTPTPSAGSDAGSAKSTTTTTTTTTAAGTGSGSAKSTTTTTAAADMGSGSAKSTTTTTTAAGTGSGSAKAPTTAAGVGTGSAKPAAMAATPTTTTTTTTAVAAPPVPKPPVVMTPELKAIKLSLLPNWKRDADEPGTFSLFVDVQSKAETQVFTFNYGYDDSRAPVDREAYKKFLTDSKILKVLADRQRGAAWLIEGEDASGPAFRMLVTYGGKRLVCYGSLYKGNGFGDIRDEVIIQAKKICETIGL